VSLTPCGAVPVVDAARCDILIVDDLPEKLLVFGTVLEDLGQNLVFVRSGADALREVLQREFAVILLDVNMPDIDGFETASLIRRYKRSAHTPIIFITAFADELQTARGYSLGAVDYILSPVVPEVLRSKVKVFVELHSMQRRLREQADERVARVAAETARRAAEDSERRSLFLSHAGRVLGDSLDHDLGVRRLLELLVPHMAACAALAFVDGQGAMQPPLAVEAWTAPDGTVSLRECSDVPTAALHTMREALARRRRVAGGVPAPAQVDLSLDDACLVRHAVAVPMLIGERALGVLLVGSRHEDAEQGCNDWEVLEGLADRAAVAFENAQLYRSLQAEIAERRAAETELQDASRRKDEFLAMLSHELRNPLAPIRNALEVVRRIAPPDSKITWAGDVMDRQVGHLTRLVEELLDVARISQGKIALNREPVDLNDVIAHSVETAQPFIEARGHGLTVQLPHTPVFLHGDFARLSQVVGNLLHNAAKFTDEGGRIHLALWVEDGESVIAVRDGGIGIDAALLPRIFDLFSQGSRSLDRSQGGLGVGLTLVRRLVELHGGRVEALSDGADRGAEFRVRLPCISVASGDTDNASIAEPSPRAAGRRVLIVDDNHDAAESVAQFLQLEGHEVKTVCDGVQAITCAPVFAPQVVVLDIGLPGLSGYDVAQRLRDLPATRQALIVAVTGYGQKEDRQRAMASGFDHHFVKPTDPHALTALIAGWTEEGEVMRPIAHPAAQ